MRLEFQTSDGGRAAAGFRGTTSDCVCRAVAIATGKPYAEVYREINAAALREKHKRKSSARTGVYKPTVRAYIESLGFRWTPTMGIGTGCRVHLCAGEIPDGRVIVKLTRHVTAVIDGMIHDTHNPDRGGTRCVYGYWIRA
jgi:hypothetical protein